MSGYLARDPSQIIRQLLVDLGLGTNPDVTVAGDWPIFSGYFPDSEVGVLDSAICVFDTDSIFQGREQLRGVMQEHFGIQVAVRSMDRGTSRTKARQVSDCFDTRILRNAVTIGEFVFSVQAVTRTSGVLNAGIENPTTRRRLYTVNAIAAINQESYGTGT